MLLQEVDACMKYTITPEAMRHLEGDYMARWGIPGALLMEHAAQGVVQALHRQVRHEGLVLFLCGPGNNGGDGYAAARLWRASGGGSLIWELTDQLRGDALLNRTLALQAGIPCLPMEAGFAHPPCRVDGVVDALYGTGLSRRIEAPASAVIPWVNALDAPIVAVDIPSGLDGLTGEILADEPIRATETVTFHRIKQGLLLRDGPACTGKLTVHDILIPRDTAPLDGLCAWEPEDLPRLLPPRAATSHKGSWGRVVILAGSPGMCGAAAFCASACVKAGAGLTTILCREGLLPVLQTLVPEAMCLPLPEKNGLLCDDASKSAAHMLATADAAIIGCGLGQSEDLLPLLRVFRDASCSVVWDADALNMLARHPELLPLPAHHIITPHIGEAARLLSVGPADVSGDPLTSLHTLQARCGCTVLLKGARSLITDGQRSFVNLYGTPALAKGGSGDVLAGMIGALLGRRQTALSPVEAASLGALLHGVAGLRAEKISGENCLSPLQLAACIRLDARDL